VSKATEVNEISAESSSRGAAVRREDSCPLAAPEATPLEPPRPCAH